MACKPEPLKRTFLGLTVVTVGMVALLYWGRLDELQSSRPRHSTWNTWTWDCEEDQCVRKVKQPEDSFLSLETCRMQCGPLPLWPQPSNVTRDGFKHARFKQLRIEIITAHEQVRSMLEKATKVFRASIMSIIPEEADMSTRLGELVVVLKVLHNDQVLSLKTNENYTLNLMQLRAEVQAHTFFGARHALETLSQLIWWDGNALRVLGKLSIRDGPIFPYRGVLVDTARNFIPIASLKRTVDGLAASKLNVLHWHVTDSQSFPFDSPRVPQMVRYGAYSPDKVYTASDVSDLVEYARIRGIRVVMEIDAPAHTGNGWQWGNDHGLGNLSLCINKQPWTSFCGEPPCGQLNPDNPHTYEILGKLYQDIVELTNVTDVFHMGGDEVDFNCWQSALHHSGNLMNKWKDFQKHAEERLIKANKGKVPSAVVLWSSKLTSRHENLNRKMHVVQVWGASEWSETADLVKRNFRVIISHVDFWYLDCGFGSWRGEGPGACHPITSWQNVYQHRPWELLKRSLVLGGEVCLWSEMMDDNSLDMKLWPRAAAFAERVWSDPESGKALREAFGRIAVHRERLVARGIRSDAIWPQWCTQNPNMCLEPLDEDMLINDVR